MPQFFLRKYIGNGSSEFNAAKGDIHHLFPSDQDINQFRGHLAFGDTDCNFKNKCKVNEESKLGLPTGKPGSTNCTNPEPDPGKFACVMQVRELRQGDIARAQFYMSIRYSIPLPDVSENIMRVWHQRDPPDAREKTRNDAIETAQGNRNPFVDDPKLVDRIANF